MLILLKIAMWFCFGAAILSSLFWIGLAFTWWRLERKRIKRIEDNEI